VNAYDDWRQTRSDDGLPVRWLGGSPADIVHLHFIPERRATGCVACRRPLSEHRRLRGDAPEPCERCGAFFLLRCYWRYVASPAEHARFQTSTEGELMGWIFLCGGCRS